MSFTGEEGADPVQPEGQGEVGESAGAQPYAEYLDRIPEQYRGDVEPVLKDWNSSVNKRFQDHAEFRKQWEPLQDTGIHQLPVEDVSWLVQFRQALEDPEVMQQWWDGYAQQNGLTRAQQHSLEDQGVSLDDFNGYQDPQVQQMLEKMLEERLGPVSQQLEQFSSRFQQQEQQAAQAEALTIIEGQVKALEKEHNNGQPFDDDTKQLINTLVGHFAAFRSASRTSARRSTATRPRARSPRRSAPPSWRRRRCRRTTTPG